jgi:xylose isomerase
MNLKISLALSMFGGGHDKYCVDGYRETPRLQEKLSAASKLKSVKGVELQQTDLNGELGAKEIKRLLKEYGLACSAVSTSLAHDRRFALGAFGHQHQKTRNAAIDEGRKAVDFAKELGTSTVLIRLYSDGFDYPFHVDYGAHWNTIISSIKTIAKYASPEVNVAIAYKPREPRTHLTVATVGKSLSLCQEIAMKNVGVGMNFSHALMAGENPAESIAFLTRANKLFACYFSDSYRMWDDSMIPGTVHTWELMEALFYLKTVKHKGFLTVDIDPGRLEPSQACQIAVGNLSIFWKKLDKLDVTELRRAQKSLDAIESQKIIRRVMLQG